MAKSAIQRRRAARAKALSTITSQTFNVGFSNIDKWISLDNYAMNRRWSGRFDRALLFGRNYVFYGESGCHAKDTEIFKSDGTLIRVQDVEVGDKLAGPDGKARNVLRLITGREMMYDVQTSIGQMRVNENHILSLYDLREQQHVDMKVKDFLSVDEPAKYQAWTPINGVDFADADSKITADEIVQRVVGDDDIWDIMSAPRNVRGEAFNALLRSHGVIQENPEAIDAWTYACKSAEHTKQVAAFARSIGLQANINHTTPNRLLVVLDQSGHHSDITLTEAGVEKFYGFELDGDHLYLMDDFTVTHNSGKSLMAAIAAKNAQKEHDAHVYWLDIEHANDDKAGKEWLERAGVDMGEDNFTYLAMATLEEIKKTIAKITDTVVSDMKEFPDDTQPVVFIVDSWAAALTESQWDRTGGKKAGELVGDLGQKAKQTGDVILSTTHLCAGKPIMVIGVQHVMDNQDKYGRKHTTTGGNKMVFMASGCMLLTKSELKEDDTEDQSVIETYKEADANMSAGARKAMGTNRFVGIKATMEMLKSRVSKPFERVGIQIPWLTGLDEYSGLFDVMQQEGTITNPTVGWYQYTKADGEVKKFRAKEFRDLADDIMASAKLDLSVREPDEPEVDPEAVPDTAPDTME